MSIYWTPSSPRADRQDSCLRPYRGETYPLTEEHLAYFESRYELPAYIAFPLIRIGSGGRYLLPIYAPDGSERGMVSRVPWDGSPLTCTDTFPKADTFRSKWGPVQSHYHGRFDNEGSSLILVEDQLSAIKLSAYGYNSVALLGKPTSLIGTYGGADRVAEIAKRAREADEVVVALDADATDEAFKFVRKWGAAFRRCRVAILSKDLKDTASKDFAEVLGV